jgi:hypothetical protein
MRRFWLWMSLALAANSGAWAGSQPSDKKSPATFSAAEKLMVESARKKAQVAQAESLKYAEAQALVRLKMDPSVCVASHNASGQCLLTSEAFNHAASDVEPDNGMGETPSEKKARILEIRMAVLRQLLEGDFLLDKLHQTGLENEVRLRAETEDRRNQALAVKAIGEARLREIHARYGSAFAAKERRKYRILAGSDTARIDSLCRRAEKEKEKGGEAAELPWVEVADTLLPTEMAEMAGKLEKAAALRNPKSMCTVPWKAGKACIRLASTHRIPAVSFQDALPMLIGLSGVVLLDSVSARTEAQGYYRSHLEEFKNPDTLALEVSVQPGGALDSNAAPPASRRLSDLDLPPRARDWLRAQDSLVKGKTLGPVFLDIGVWTFKVGEKRRGKGYSLFQTEADRIVERLQRQRTNQELANAGRSQVRKQRNLGAHVFEKILEERFPPSETDLSARMRADSAEMAGLLPKGTPPERFQVNLETMARIKLQQESRARDYDSWLKDAVTLTGVDPD